MKKISDNVYVETGKQGCNHGFVTTTEGVVMIDAPQKSSDAEEWREIIDSKGELSYIINMEYHIDHVASLHLFSGRLISHNWTRDALKAQKFRLADITFSDRMKLHLGEHTFELIHLPGHTPGETAVYIPEESVLFTGDNIFYKVQTFLQDALPFDWCNSLEVMKEIDADILVPGHGEFCGKEYISEQTEFIKEWIDAVRGAIDGGLSKKEAADKISFLDRYPMDVGLKSFGKTLQKMNVNRLYDILKEEV